jgi:hypothetical protein
MSITVRCAQCGHTVQTRSENAGKRARCRKCDGQFTLVPLALPAPAEEMAPPRREPRERRPPRRYDDDFGDDREREPSLRKAGWILAPNPGVLVLFLLVAGLVTLLLSTSLLTAAGLLSKYEVILMNASFNADGGRITVGEGTFLDMRAGSGSPGYLTTNWWPLVILAFFGLPTFLAWAIVQQCRRAFRKDGLAWTFACTTGFLLLITVITPMISVGLTKLRDVSNLKFREYERLGNTRIGTAYAVRADSPLLFLDLLIQLVVVGLLAGSAWLWFKRLKLAFHKASAGRQDRAPARATNGTYNSATCKTARG